MMHEEYSGQSFNENLKLVVLDLLNVKSMTSDHKFSGSTIVTLFLEQGIKQQWGFTYSVIRLTVTIINTIYYIL